MQQPDIQQAFADAADIALFKGIHADDRGQFCHCGAFQEVLPVQRQKIDQHIGGGNNENEVPVAGQGNRRIIGHQSETDPIRQEKRQNARNQVRDIHVRIC